MSLSRSLSSSHTWQEQVDDLTQLCDNTLVACKERKANIQIAQPTRKYDSIIEKNLKMIKKEIESLEHDLSVAESGQQLPPAELRRREDNIVDLTKYLEHLEEYIDMHPLNSNTNIGGGSGSSGGGLGSGGSSSSNAANAYSTANSGIGAGGSGGNGGGSRISAMTGTSRASTAASAAAVAALNDGNDAGRPEDTVSLLNIQKTMIRQQDDSLDQLSLILERQKNIGLQISSELDSQMILIEEVDSNLENTHGRLGRTVRDMTKFTRTNSNSKSNLSCCLIASLVFAIVLILLILVVVKRLVI